MHLSCIMTCALAAVGLIGASAQAGDPTLMITEVVDGTLPNGQPKWVEITNCGPLSVDLSQYSIGNMNNGSTTLGGGASIQLAGALAPGLVHVVAYSVDTDTTFADTYGFAPDQYAGGGLINGDDVLILFFGQATGDGSDATIVDIYGVIGVDGTGEPWEHTDSYSYRLPNQIPTDTFDEAQWFIAGPNALETGDDREELVLLQTLTSAGVYDCCPADLDGSGEVDINDLLNLLANWGQCCIGDIDGDGVVGRSDLAILLALLDTPCDGNSDEGTIDHTLVAIDNTAGDGDDGFVGGVTDFTFDLRVTVTGTSDWTTGDAIGLIDAQLGVFYQHPSESGSSSPPFAALIRFFPALEFDSYFCSATVIAPGEAGADPEFIVAPTTQLDHEVFALWVDILETGGGTFTIARYTLRLNQEPMNPIEIVPSGSEPEKVLLASITGTSTHSATEAVLAPFAFDLVMEPSPGDLDANGFVDAADLATLLGDWGPTKDCPPFSPADIDEDCDVDAADLAALLGEWG